MSNIKISIGRSSESDVQIDDATVSNHHAVLQLLKSGYQLVDKNSTNGTFVNGRRIKISLLDSESEIKFGSYKTSMIDLLSKSRQIINTQKTDFTLEYKSLLHLFKQYQSRKDVIQSQSKGPLVFRLLTSGIFVAIILFFPDLISNAIRYPLIILIGLIPLFYNLVFNQRKKKQELIALLDLEFEERLQCPKCGYRMIGFNYTYWQGRTSCLNKKCNAVFQ